MKWRGHGGSSCGLILGDSLATAWRVSGNHEKYVKIVCILAKIHTRHFQDTPMCYSLSKLTCGFIVKLIKF
jgi:hypothetical protein